jgi:hypothetical protein
MPETTPAAPRKTFLLSKTFWLQVIALASTVSPVVREWIAANPETAVGVLAAANILLRFATSGKVSFFPTEVVEENNGPAGGLSPLWVVGLGMAVGCMGCLPSCSPAQMDAARAIPIKFTLITPGGDIGYSSKRGLSVDYYSAK